MRKTHALRFACGAATTLLLANSAVYGQTTVTFQQGVNGYNGAFEKRIGSDLTNGELGSASQAYFMDGPGTGSADQQDLLRFDGLFGNGPGQIPVGAIIQSARLTITTGTGGNAQTGGPYGVAGLRQAFDATTEYASFGANGPTLAGGQITRPTAGLQSGTFNHAVGEAATADVTELVSSWANGSTNFGFNIRAFNTTDGWQISTIGNSTIAARPELAITYTVAPPGLQTISFQQGVNGYNGTQMAWLQQNNTTTDGAALTQQFLDGPDGGTSPDDQALVRFTNIIGGGAGQLPTGAIVEQAWLVVTSGNTSANTESNGAYDAHQMLTDWTLASTYAGFNGDGPTIADGEIAAASGSAVGMIDDGRALFDVTGAVQSWVNGQSNFGFNIQAATADGWQINFLGGTDPTVRPELIVRYRLNAAAVPEPGTVALFGLGLLPLAGVAMTRRRRTRRQG